MPRILIKLSDTQRDYYYEWSTVVDAPITQGMTLEELKEYIKFEYGNAGLEQLTERLERVEKNGHSMRGYYETVETVEEFISGNRAGDNESTLTKEEIIKQYS